MNTEAHCTTSNGKPLNFEGVVAKGNINGLMLEMTLEQRFRNPEPTNVEVVYTFPLPWAAVLLDIEVLLNGQKLTGMVRAKQEARESYEQAIAEGDMGVLLVRNHDQSYTLELGNLLAGESCVVVLKYAQVLQPEHGSLRITLPTAIAPWFGSPVHDGGYEPHAAPVTSITAEYPFEISLHIYGELAQARIASPGHPISIQAATNVAEVRLGRSSWLDRDFVLILSELVQQSFGIVAPDQLEHGTSTVLVSFSPAMEHVAAPVALKILVDCSGSMGGDSMEAARRALGSIVGSLGAADRFCLSRFGDTVVHRGKSLWQASGPAKASANRWVESLQADLGGTEMAHALESTMSIQHSGPSDVFMVTDGEIYAIDQVLELARKSGQRIFVIGIGSSPAETHLRRLAHASHGACEFVAPGEDAEPAILRMFKRVRSHAVQNIKIQWPKSCTVLRESNVPEFVFPGDTATVFATLATPFGECVAGEVCMTGELSAGCGEQLLAKSSMTSIADPQNTLARLNASARCRTDERINAAHDSKTNELVQTAERYRLVTDQTSFILVNERMATERPDQMPEVRQVPQMLAAGWGGLGHLSIPDVQCSFEPPINTRRRAHLPDNFNAAGMDDFEIPAFLRRTEDAPDVKSTSAGVDQSDPELWTGLQTPGLDTSQREATSPGDDHQAYVGLTPAGLIAFLQTTDPQQWPRTFGDLRAIGLGMEVVECLEFEVGSEHEEHSVVAAFIGYTCFIKLDSNSSLETRFQEFQESSCSSATEAVGALDKCLDEKVRSLFAGTTRRQWPERVLNFPEYS